MVIKYNLRNSEKKTHHQTDRWGVKNFYVRFDEHVGVFLTAGPWLILLQG